MLPLRLLKDSRLIAAPMGPQGKDDPDPNIGKRTHGNGMAFAFRPFALVVVSGPGFTLCGLPSKLMKRIAQRFDTPQAAMRLGVRPALIKHWRGSPQCLQTVNRLIARPVLSDLSKQSGSQTLACSWQALKEIMILMSQKRVRISLSYCAICSMSGNNWLTNACSKRDFARVVAGAACN